MARLLPGTPVASRSAARIWNVVVAIVPEQLFDLRQAPDEDRDVRRPCNGATVLELMELIVHPGLAEVAVG